MKRRIAQTTMAVAIIVIAMLMQLAPVSDLWQGTRRSASSASSLGGLTPALAQDDNDEDNADNEDADNADNEDEDNEDGDNADNDEDADNDDADNEDADNDGEDDNADDDDDLDDELDNDEADADLVDADISAGPAYAFNPAVVEAIGLSTGGDGLIGLPGDRVVVQIFPWMPAGVTFTVRLLDPSAVPTTPPGNRVGDLIFQIQARDSGGEPLAELPAEVNLSARYTDTEVVSAQESLVTLVWLDPVDSQWKPAPKVVADQTSNYVAASVTAVGVYAVVIP
jgi:hypothetical protein